MYKISDTLWPDPSLESYLPKNYVVMGSQKVSHPVTPANPGSAPGQAPESRRRPYG